MKRFNLSEWALRTARSSLYAMLVLALLRRPLLHEARAVGGPAVHVQGDGGAHRLAGRDRAGGRASRSPTRSSGSCRRRRTSTDPRATRSPANRWCSFRQGFGAPAAVPGHLVPGAQEVGDIRDTLPAGHHRAVLQRRVRRHVYGNIYALAGDGFSYAELKKYADRIRARAPARARRREGRPTSASRTRRSTSSSRTPSSRRSASTCRRSCAALAQQNAVAPAGAFETPTDQHLPARLRRLRLGRGDPRDRRSARTGASSASATSRDVQRGYADPPQPRCASWARRRSASAVSMVQGGDIIALGRALDARVERIAGDAAGRPRARAASTTSRRRCSARSTSSCARSPRR